jgi:tripartite ATP-independent transporter DctM subunit
VTTEVVLLLGVMLGLLAAGLPVFLAMALAVATYALVFAPVMPPLVVVQTFVQGLDNGAFTAIPYFFLAGTVMNAGGMSARLLRLARAVVGHFRGGLSHANVGANMVFAGVSGSAVADAAAVGSLMIPAMKRDGYGGAYAAAVTAAAATIGPIIPPSIPMVIFGLFTGASISKLFLGGIVPGLLMGAFLLVTTGLIARRRGFAATRWLGFGELGAAARDALFALLLPVLVIYGLVSGIATTSEIGALACVYAALVSVLIYRDLDWFGLWRTVVEAAIDAARVLIIMAVAGAFVWIIANIGAAKAIAAWLAQQGLGATAVLALIVVILLVLGCVLEPVTLLVVVVPMLVPAALAAGVDIVHLGVVAVLACTIGLVTPPVGILIYLTAAQAEVSAGAVVRELTPFLAALITLQFVLVLWPDLVLWLPRRLSP